MLPDGDVLLSEIAEQIIYASPVICPNNTYNKTYEMGEIIKESRTCEAINLECLSRSLECMKPYYPEKLLV